MAPGWFVKVFNEVILNGMIPFDADTSVLVHVRNMWTFSSS